MAGKATKPWVLPTFLALMALLIIAFSACTGQEPAEKEPGEQEKEAPAVDESGAVGEPAIEGQESVMEDEDANVRETEGEAGSGEEFVPTEEQPHAPPAQPAIGAEWLPDGELGFAVSLGGLEPAQVLWDGAEVAVGDNLRIQCTIANKTEETIVISFVTAQKLDAIFEDIEGNVVYTWSEGKRFPQVVDTLELEAGDEWSHELTVDIGEGEFQLLPGTYAVTVRVTGRPLLEVNALDVVIIR